MQWILEGGSRVHSKTHPVINISQTKNQWWRMFSLRLTQFTIGLVMKLWWQTRPFIIYSSSIMSPKVNWAVFNEGPSDSFNFEIAIWGWLELLKTYDGKFCLKFFTLTAVSSDNCQNRHLSANARRIILTKGHCPETPIILSEIIKNFYFEYASLSCSSIISSTTYLCMDSVTAFRFALFGI